MTSLYGQLAGLKELGLLDCVSYITGASGSTWALANLSEDPEWSQKDLAGPTELLKTQVTKNKLGVLAPSQLQRYQQELAERARLGYPSCFTNLWALINEALLHDEPHDHKLSDQREALSHGQNPLPIYCALNTKGQSLTTLEFGEWCEFSPYEVGFPKYGAFIPSELFGSEFFMGQLMKRLPESRICFLEGIWSNLYAANLQDSLYWASEPSQFWDRWVRNQANLDKEQVPLLKIEEPPSTAGRIAEFFTDLLTWRPLAQATHNFLRGLHFHKDYFQHPHFSTWKATTLDGLPNQLTPSEPHLCLLDVGYLLNTSCLPLLQPTRDVDLILSLDYNLHGAFQQLQLLGRFCQEQGIPFPPISPSPEEQLQPRECHTFSTPPAPEPRGAALSSGQRLLPGVLGPWGPAATRGGGSWGGEPVFIGLSLPLHEGDLQPGGRGQAAAPDTLQCLQQPGAAAGGSAPGSAAEAAAQAPLMAGAPATPN
ncbi:hypothetical protein CK820_G0053551 [Pan troglodytes]|nr:hypothetical protein CK820_G0053551 [Pan troglodytes]